MLSEINTYFFEKPEKAYSEWCFPKNKSTLINGLIFTFITVTALSFVDHFYYSESYYSSLQPPQIKPFGVDRIFRLLLIPILNIAMIFLARTQWNNSVERLERIGIATILGSLIALLGTGFCHEYYSADDFAFDTLVLIIFTQTILGFNFRTGFLVNLLLVLTTIIYVWIDDLEIKVQMYNTTIILLLWVPVLFGTLRLEKARVLNYKTIFELKTSNNELAQTHQKVAEQKKLLRAGERVSQLASWKARSTFDTVHYSDGIYDIYEFNPAEVPAKDLYTKTLRRVHPDDLEKVILSIDRINKKQFSKNIKSIEYRIVLPNNKIKWLRYTIGEYRIGKGFVGTVQDITKSKTLELELQQALDELKIKNEDLQQFAYASSHDLQEPLRSITNFSQLLNRSMGNQVTADQRMFLDFILNSTNRMSKLISAILEYSRIGRNKKKTQINSNEVVKEILEDLSYALQETGGQIKVSTLPTIIGFRSEFRMLLQNLIGNGLKFRHKDRSPIIHISSQSSKTHYQFSVRDNGIGIDKKYIHKIFQLFSRLHSKEAYEGTGIGLTHSKKIVELHGGTIWVEANEEGGSTFYFTISKTLEVTEIKKEMAMHEVH